ncbi:SEC-C metal-binding domain-containing protein [Desulforamulus ruminis]|uniref:SEC-C metal-binding domain-containing protein n=1 Tax=Desulforamulus ruminis TaxID=1564 RepID=UPI002FD9EDD1
MGRVTTPRVITPEIRELCRSISEHEPAFVAVNVDPDSLINECFHNVDTYIEKHGGQRVLGRSIWHRANVLIEAEAHAIWKSPTGEMFDITPHTNNETSILFLVDHQMTYSENCIPNIRKALTSSPLVAEFIGLFNERDRIASESPLNTFSLPTYMVRRMMEIEQILNQRVGRNDPCPCQSGIKYKKCCGKYET